MTGSLLPVERLLLFPTGSSNVPDGPDKSETLSKFFKGAKEAFEAGVKNKGIFIDLLHDIKVKDGDDVFIQVHVKGVSKNRTLLLNSLAEFEKDGETALAGVASKFKAYDCITYFEYVAKQNSYIKDKNREYAYDEIVVQLSSNMGISIGAHQVAMIISTIKDLTSSEEKLDAIKAFDFVETLKNASNNDEDDEDESIIAKAHKDASEHVAQYNSSSENDEHKWYETDEKQYKTEKKKEIAIYYKAVRDLANRYAKTRGMLVNLVLIRPYEMMFFQVLRRMLGIFIALFIILFFPAFWLGLLKAMRSSKSLRLNIACAVSAIVLLNFGKWLFNI